MNFFNKTTKNYLQLIFFLLFTILTYEKLSAAAAVSPIQIISPDKTVKLVVRKINNNLTYQVFYNGIQIIEPSPLGMIINQREIGSNIIFGKSTNYRANEKYFWRGNHSLAINHYNASKISILNADGQKSFIFDVRVFNDGIAFRYVVDNSESSIISDDKTNFLIPTGSEVWTQNNIKYYEGKYQNSLIENIKKDEPAGPPLVFQLKNRLIFAAITEAGLTDFSGISLIADGNRGFKAKMSGVTIKTGIIETPWRVVEVAKDLNSLVNSDIIANLSPAFDPKLFPKGFETDWIKPGRSVWSYLTPNRSITLENMKRFSDYAAELGFEYNLVDEGWSNWKDSANGRNEWDMMKELVDYSAEKGIKIWVWKAYPDRKGIPGIQTAEKRRAFFKKAQELGIAGLKIDFFDSENQGIIQFYQAALRDAAEFHLMLDFHGANKPTGESRAFPNEMTREAVRGLENRPPWSAHNTILPFTRYLAGHADYTPLHFGDRMGETSWAHQIASMIIFNSPFLCLGAAPDDILRNPNKEIIKSIPAVWDETIVLSPSKMGDLALFARRKGHTWFVAAMNGPTPKQIKIKLTFLGNYSYNATYTKDDQSRQNNSKNEYHVAVKKTVLTVNLNSGGGFVGMFVKNE